MKSVRAAESAAACFVTWWFLITPPTLPFRLHCKANLAPVRQSALFGTKHHSKKASSHVPGGGRTTEEQLERGIVEAAGVVKDALPGGQFVVVLDSTAKRVVCELSGKIRKNRIKVIPGDAVTVHLSIVDLTKGRIHRRMTRSSSVVSDEPMT